MNWEYDWRAGGDIHSMIETLDELGAQRWEVIWFEVRNGKWSALLKREEGELWN